MSRKHKVQTLGNYFLKADELARIPVEVLVLFVRRLNLNKGSKWRCTLGIKRSQCLVLLNHTFQSNVLYIYYIKISSNMSHFHVALKFLGNRLTDQDQILYTYSLEISKTKEL